MTGQITRFRAVMPPEAWKNGREPRERRRRRTAVDDLIGGLDRYLSRLQANDLLLVTIDGKPMRSDYTDMQLLRQWTTWAARLADPYVRYGFGPAPDGSEWSIKHRLEYL